VNNFERRDLIGLNTILAVVALCTIGILVGDIDKLADDLDRTVAPAARLEAHCGFIRLQLAQELDWLAATDSKQKQVMAQVQFDNFTGDGWREVALCTPEGVRIARTLCLDGDLACMSAATANAVLMVGAR